MTGPTGDLVGRSQEMDRLTGALTGALRALVVEGDAGVGKTALLDDLGRRAGAEGWTVARYQCVEAEQDFPYSTLAQILRRSWSMSTRWLTTSAAPSTSSSAARSVMLPP